MGCREHVLAWSSCRERRAAHAGVRVEAHSECHGAFHSCRGRWKFRALCASGLFKFVSVPLWKQEGGDACLWSCAPFARYNRTHIPRFSCFVRVDATDKLTNQDEESCTGREGLTKLHSMVPLYMMKKIDLISLELFAMYSWLMTAEQSKLIEQSRWQSLSIFQICRSYQWSVLAAVVQLASLRRKTTDLACARSSVDALFD